MTVQVKTSLPTQLLADIDKKRGDVSRSLYLRRLIEKALQKEKA